MAECGFPHVRKVKIEGRMLLEVKTLWGDVMSEQIDWERLTTPHIVTSKQ